MRSGFPIVASEGMHFIDDHRLNRAEEVGPVSPSRDENGFEALWRRKKNIRWVAKNPRPRCLTNVAMPQTASPANKRTVVGETLFEVVQQRSNGTNIKNALSPPGLAQHAREYRKDGG